MEANPFLAALEFARRHWLVAALLAALVVQTVRIEGFKVWPLSFDGLKKEAKDAKDALRKLKDEGKRASDEQKDTTARNVIVYRDRIVNGGKVAERIEQAPLPGGCRTPREIIGADL